MVDQRSDIFSFGVVLYEMLTGVHPFRRSTSAETAAAILTADPPPLSRHMLSPPPTLDELLARMLAKDPETRLQTAAAVRSAIEEIKAQFESGRSSAAGSGGTVFLPAQAEAPVNAGGRSIEGSRRLGRLGRGAALVALPALTAALLAVYYFRPQQPERAEPRVELLVDWPGRESDARMSADGQWFSFVSDQGGATMLWRRHVSGGEPQKLAVAGVPISHAWSPEPRDPGVACLVQQQDNLVLLRVRALFEEPPEVLFSADRLPEEARADLSARIPEALAWLPGGIYLKGRSTIWRWDRAAKALVPVWKYAEAGAASIDIRGDGEALAYAANGDIWTADLDGGNRRSLTRDEYADSNPHWIRRAHGWSVIYSSNRFGQEDLWESMPGSNRAERVFIQGGENLYVEDCAADGSAILYRLIREEANLWCLDLKNGDATLLSTGVLPDHAPTVAEDANLIAFQRARNRQAADGRAGEDGMIYLAGLAQSGLTNLRWAIPQGSAPFLSPNGRWLSYLRHNEREAYDLWLKDLLGTTETRISEQYRVYEFTVAPMDWGPRNEAWDWAGSVLFYVETAEGDRPALRRIRPDETSGAAGGAETLAVGNPGDHFLDPRPAPGGGIAYVARRKASPPVWELRLLHPQSARDELLFSDRECTRLYCLGWLGRQAVALRKGRPARRGDSAAPTEIVTVDPGGRTVTMKVHDRAYGQTAHLDPAGRVVYLSAVEDEKRNLLAFDMDARSVRRLTDNKREDVYFTGLQACAGGRLFYSQQRRISDLYRMSFESK